MDYATFVNSSKTMLIAPAGYGKTYTIVECLKYTTGRQLILTHTHAGVTAIKSKIKAAKIENSKYHIETISSFAQKYVNAFYTNNDVPPQETKEYFPFIIKTACKIVNIGVVKKIVTTTYTGLFVDEYQDCSKTQHQMIMILSSVLPTHILGDPLQGIFDFNDKIVDFESDIDGFEISRLATPYRWNNNGRQELGDALNNMRAALENSDDIDLEKYKNVNGLYVLLVNQRVPDVGNDITNVNSDYRKWLNKLLNNPEGNPDFNSLLLLVPNTGAGKILNKNEDNIHKKDIHSRKKLRAIIDYKKSLNLLEAIDEADFYSISKNIDKVINEIKRARNPYTRVKKDILEKIFNKTDINLWFNNKGLKSKIGGEEKAKSENIKKIMDELIANPSSTNMYAIIKTLKEGFKFKYGREELLYGVMKAIETAIYENIAVLDGMKQHRNVVRRVGRKVTGKCLGTTLLTKGLEFNTVAILAAHEFDCPKHLYVALTRCCKNLIIFTEKTILTPYKRKH